MSRGMEFLIWIGLAFGLITALGYFLRWLDDRRSPPHDPHSEPYGDQPFWDGK